MSTTVPVLTGYPCQYLQFHNYLKQYILTWVKLNAANYNVYDTLTDTCSLAGVSILRWQAS